jgi:hypothetical protein
MKIGMRRLHLFILLFVTCSLLFHFPSDFQAFAVTSDGTIDSTVEINDSTPNGPELANGYWFGGSVANIGDLDGDGVNDLAVGANLDSGAGTKKGAVHILFMNTDGSVDSTKEIDDDTPNGPELTNNDRFGTSVANIGDLDGDGVNDLAVGARLDDIKSDSSEGDANWNAGAVHILFMNTDGSVKSTEEINDSTPNGPELSEADTFGTSVANIGDLDGDGVNDLAVGARLDDEGGADSGAVHIIFMNTDGSVDSTVEINDSTPNSPTLTNNDHFGDSVANIGDLDGDGVNDLAVGAIRDDAGGTDRGAVHIIFMNTDGSVKSTEEINDSTPNGPELGDEDRFGDSVANIGDLDGDGVNDLAVGAPNDDTKSNGTDGGRNWDAGGAYIIFMNTDGSVKSTEEINDSTANGPELSKADSFGHGVANIGDLDGNGVNDIVVGAILDDGIIGSNRGTVHIMFMHETTKPTVTITSSTGSSGDTVSYTTLSYTATFSESVSNFTIEDITVTGTANGGSPEASNFVGSGTTYTFDAVQGSSDGTVSASIAAGVATDAAGNENTVSNTYMLTIDTASSTCSRHVILGNCGTIAINNDEYRIINTWTNVPTTEILVGQPVTVTLSTPHNPTHTKIHFASVHTEVFSIPVNFDQTAHIDYSPVNNQVTYVSQSQLFQVAGATHRIVQDPDVKNLEMFEVVFTMIFAKQMDTSHVVVETENKHGIPETLYLLDALKVNENLAQALTLEEKSKFSIVEPEMDPEPEIEMDPEPEQTKKEKSKRQRR